MVTDKSEIKEELRILDEIEHQTDDKPVVPLAGVVYGDTIYWGTILGTIVTLFGQMLSFLTQNNHMSPSYLLSSLWQGKKVEDIWDAVGGTPEGHWYIERITTGDGLTTFGLAFGVFTVTPAIIGAAVVLFRQQHRLFAALAVIAALITLYSLIA